MEHHEAEREVAVDGRAALRTREGGMSAPRGGLVAAGALMRRGGPRAVHLLLGKDALASSPAARCFGFNVVGDAGFRTLVLEVHYLEKFAGAADADATSGVTVHEAAFRRASCPCWRTRRVPRRASAGRRSRLFARTSTRRRWTRTPSACTRTRSGRGVWKAVAGRGFERARTRATATTKERLNQPLPPRAHQARVARPAAPAAVRGCGGRRCRKRRVRRRGRATRCG